MNTMNLRENIYLIKHTTHQLFGCKLLSNKQVLRNLFHNMSEVKLSLRDIDRLVIEEVIIFC